MHAFGITDTLSERRKSATWEPLSEQPQIVYSSDEDDYFHFMKRSDHPGYRHQVLQVVEQQAGSDMYANTVYQHPQYKELPPLPRPVKKSPANQNLALLTSSPSMGVLRPSDKRVSDTRPRPMRPTKSLADLKHMEGAEPSKSSNERDLPKSFSARQRISHICTPPRSPPQGIFERSIERCAPRTNISPGEAIDMAVPCTLTDSVEAIANNQVTVTLSYNGIQVTDMNDISTMICGASSRSISPVSVTTPTTPTHAKSPLSGEYDMAGTSYGTSHSTWNHPLTDSLAQFAMDLKEGPGAAITPSPPFSPNFSPSTSSLSSPRSRPSSPVNPTPYSLPPLHESITTRPELKSYPSQRSIHIDISTLAPPTMFDTPKRPRLPKSQSYVQTGSFLAGVDPHTGHVRPPLAHSTSLYTSITVQGFASLAQDDDIEPIKPKKSKRGMSSIFKRRSKGDEDVQERPMHRRHPSMSQLLKSVSMKELANLSSRA